MSSTLFGAVDEGPAALPPLAVRMRPRSLDEVRGQARALAPGLLWSAVADQYVDLGDSLSSPVASRVGAGALHVA